MSTNGEKKIGFALGGLGGFNAHGVGFLQAARKNRIIPKMISCTSGMIWWAAQYLDEKSDLPKILNQQIQTCNRFPAPFEWMNVLWLACTGDPGIFRPAVAEYWKRWLTPMKEISASQILDRMIPAQMYVPLRDPAEFDNIANIFNNSKTGIIFNTFHPLEGKCHLHINEAAMKLFTEQNGGPVTGYHPITPAVVLGALWLYFYGFEDGANPEGTVDGAYNRQFIISELSPCDRVYVVRPQNSNWLGRMPGNALEIADFIIETWLNSAYVAEVAGMELVNKLLAQNPSLTRGKNAKPYHPIKLIPVQVQHNYGLFDYFVEHESVYNRAVQASATAFMENEPLTFKAGN